MNGREPFPDLLLRPATERDLTAIVATYRRLSRESLYQRFFTLMPDPTDLVARQLALVDHRDHESLVVLDGDQVVAVAQWDRDRAQRDAAEVAVTVEDAWQHRGLGRALVRALVGDAHRHGVATITASVLSANRSGLGLASGLSPALVGTDGPETHFLYAVA
jgi:L-amino acid N-acyltransferase YncA